MVEDSPMVDWGDMLNGQLISNDRCENGPRMEGGVSRAVKGVRL